MGWLQKRPGSRSHAGEPMKRPAARLPRQSPRPQPVHIRQSVASDTAAPPLRRHEWCRERRSSKPFLRTGFILRGLVASAGILRSTQRAVAPEQVPAGRAGHGASRWGGFCSSSFSGFDLRIALVSATPATPARWLIHPIYAYPLNHLPHMLRPHPRRLSPPSCLPACCTCQEATLTCLPTGIKADG